MDFRYWDEYGEGITEEEAFEAYDDMLDCLHDEVFGILPSTILKECDPIAYRVGFNDFEDSQLEDGSWVDEDPTEDEEEEEEIDWEQYWEDFDKGLNGGLTDPSHPNNKN